MDWNELENALEWYGAAPQRWYDSGKQDLSAAAEWIWNVLQGDFADQQSTAQVVTGTVISMIPGVDQLCDLRDLVADCRHLEDEIDSPPAWIALSLTLVGLFPELGSLAKGGCKIMFAYGRKSAFRAGSKAVDSQFWEQSRPYVEAGIGKLNQYLQTPAVRRTLSVLQIHQPYHFLAGKVRDVKGSLSVGTLLAAFDKALQALRSLVGMIRRWGGDALAKRADDMLNSVLRIRNKAGMALEKIIAPVTNWLNRLANRIDREADMEYRAIVKSTNAHRFTRQTLQQEETHFAKNKPDWVDIDKKLPFKPMRSAPNTPEGWPNLSRNFKTFNKANAITIPPGETLYRVVDPDSYDDGVFWMRESEFKALKSKSQWRRRFAVWGGWNRNGEYVTYTVPPGSGLKVWEGPAASQELRPGSAYTLEGGGPQLAVDPADLEIASYGKRQSTDWGYSDFPGESDAKLGLPRLTNNIRSLEKK